jgi:Tol biopolymer transport system component
VASTGVRKRLQPPVHPRGHRAGTGSCLWVGPATRQTKLVGRDTNGTVDAYLHNMENGRTTLVSRSWRGRVGNGHSVPNDISNDGRYVLFVSDATNIVRRATNGDFDHSIYDRVEKTAIRVNVNNRGKEARGGNEFTLRATIAGDGAWVAFESSAYNLVRNDTNDRPDVFLRGPFAVLLGE